MFRTFACETGRCEPIDARVSRRALAQGVVVTVGTCERSTERGAALVLALLSLGLLMALAMAMSLTAVSELGVTNAYSTHTSAFQVAEAGLTHAVSLTRNYKGPHFTSLLARRDASLNPFDFPLGSADFAPGAEPIPSTATGRQLFDASGSPIPGAFYLVRVIDDEPSGLANPSVPNFNPDASWLENLTDADCPVPNDPTCDRNNKLVVLATGTYGNSSVTLEGWVAYLLFPALVANDNILVSGNSEITGRYGGVHSNNNLSFSGSAYLVAQTATAAGTVTGAIDGNIGGFFGGGQERLDLPVFVTRDPNPADPSAQSPHLQEYIIQKADVLLLDPGFADAAHPNDPNGIGDGVDNSKSGRLRKLADRLNIPYASLAAAIDQDPSNTKVDQGVPVAIRVTRASDGSGTASPATLVDVGWKYSTSSSTSTWDILNGNAADKTFYVIGQDNYNLGNPSSSSRNGGNVKITGNPGPIRLSVLATGSIEAEGTPDIAANLRDLETPELPPFVKVSILFAAVEDIKILGDVSAGLVFRFAGIMYGGEQVYLSGNGSIDNGQVISLSNVHNAGTPVEANEILGNFQLNFSGGSGIGKIQLQSWRQIKKGTAAP